MKTDGRQKTATTDGLDYRHPRHVVLITCLCLLFWLNLAVAETSPDRPFKILHIMSYHSPWKWTDDQFAGFKDGLKGVDVEYTIFEMDTKRQGSPEWNETIGRQARKLIDSLQPDLVYTNDDNAQEYVAKYYVNHHIPFVFSGVNAYPGNYGFIGSSNITGVLEQEHFIASVELLLTAVPAVRRVAIILDDERTWPGVVQRMKQQLNLLPNIEVVSWDVIHTFKEYKEKIIRYQDAVDAIGLIGIFTFKDEDNQNVPYLDVLRWTAEHSTLPDFTFWKDRISHGSLCTVTVSGYEQGLAAGKIARGILVDNQSPSSFAIQPTVKGEAVVSLARANQLGISFPSSILLSAEVIEQFSWE